MFTQQKKKPPLRSRLTPTPTPCSGAAAGQTQLVPFADHLGLGGLGSCYPWLTWSPRWGGRHRWFPHVTRPPLQAPHHCCPSSEGRGQRYNPKNPLHLGGGISSFTVSSWRAESEQTSQGVRTAVPATSKRTFETTLGSCTTLVCGSPPAPPSLYLTESIKGHR